MYSIVKVGMDKQYHCFNMNDAKKAFEKIVHKINRCKVGEVLEQGNFIMLFDDSLNAGYGVGIEIRVYKGEHDD